MSRDIDELLKAAVAQYAAMSPVDKALHDDEQRRSFVRGQGGTDPGPGVLAEEVRRLRARLTAAEGVDRLRSEGWSVAVHNDYRLAGERMTFWLFTHPDGRWIKGEGAMPQPSAPLPPPS